MIPPGTILQGVLQVLSNPAWTGIGVLASSILSYIALRNSRQPHTNHQPHPQKNLGRLEIQYVLPSPQQSQTTLTYKPWPLKKCLKPGTSFLNFY